MNYYAAAAFGGRNASAARRPRVGRNAADYVLTLNDIA